MSLTFQTGKPTQSKHELGSHHMDKKILAMIEFKWLSRSSYSDFSFQQTAHVPLNIFSVQTLSPAAVSSSQSDKRDRVWIFGSIWAHFHYPPVSRCGKPLGFVVQYNQWTSLSVSSLSLDIVAVYSEYYEKEEAQPGFGFKLTWA